MKTHILDVEATENNDNDDGNLRATFLSLSPVFSLPRSENVLRMCKKIVTKDRKGYL